MTNRNDNSFNIVGTVTRIEEKENQNGKYIMLNVIPAWCKKWITFFVSPEYKNGEENRVYNQLKDIKPDTFVKLTVSPFNNRLFLFGVRPFNTKEDQGD